jgi:hypothetical protein
MKAVSFTRVTRGSFAKGFGCTPPNKLFPPRPSLGVIRAAFREAAAPPGTMKPMGLDGISAVRQLSLLSGIQKSWHLLLGDACEMVRES